MYSLRRYPRENVLKVDMWFTEGMLPARTLPEGRQACQGKGKNQVRKWFPAEVWPHLVRMGKSGVGTVQQSKATLWVSFLSSHWLWAACRRRNMTSLLGGTQPEKGSAPERGQLWAVISPHSQQLEDGGTGPARGSGESTNRLYPVRW